MLPHLGMVEWVDNTITFKGVLEEESGMKVEDSKGCVAQRAWMKAVDKNTADDIGGNHIKVGLG
jgi:hypothetical protein